MSETTTQMQDFLTRQAKVCHDNCEIEKDLYKELVKESYFIEDIIYMN